MRLFIGIKLPEKILNEIFLIQNNLPKFIGKKTEKQNIHLTLKFLGELNQKYLEKIKENLRKIKSKKIIAEINKIGFFSEEFLRIIWLSLDNCDELQKLVDSSLENIFKREERFMGHITIARIKDVANKDLFIKEVKDIKVNKMSFEVNKFCLMQSILTSSGIEYKVIEEFYLE
jgi:RNA 2',3'-cyclic 3'-phosphodiesterase